ncbi:MAG TPA: hypothetical protein VGO80_08615 [Solirubrobacteraceae bacterium]|nr:hypothetical protein [Solirubrobacteraceae bacterium]
MRLLIGPRHGDRGDGSAEAQAPATTTAPSGTSTSARELGEILGMVSDHRPLHPALGLDRGRL